MTASNVLRLPLASAAVCSTPAVVGVYTPLWYAARVLNITANSWWDGGVPPARKPRERATDAVAQVAASVVRHMKPPRARPAQSAAC